MKSPSPPTTKLKLLVVDDNPLYGVLVSEAFRNATNLEVEKTVAENIPAGLEKFIAFKPDVTLLDIDLPGGGSGLDLLDTLLTANPQSYIIMMTGRRDAAAVKRAQQAGAQGYIAKPFTAEKINAAVMGYQTFCAQGRPSRKNASYQAPPKAAQPVPLEDILAALNVLYVTADPNLSALCTPLPCRARFAASGKEALRHLKKHRADVLLVDAALPDMNGLQLANQVRLADENAPIKTQTVVLFENAAQVNLPQMKLSGVTSHMVKPLAVGQIHQRLLACAQRYRDHLQQPLRV